MSKVNCLIFFYCFPVSSIICTNPIVDTVSLAGSRPMVLHVNRKYIFFSNATGLFYIMSAAQPSPGSLAGMKVILFR